MKRLGFGSLYLFAVMVFAWLLGGCSDDNKKIGNDESLLSVNVPSVSMNKKGLGDDGGALKVVVTSNTFWEAVVPEGADEWLSFSAVAGEPGETVLSLVALTPNTEAEARLAKVMFRTFNREALVELSVEQRGVKDDAIIYVVDGFGGTAVGNDIPLSDYVASATGFTGAGVYYKGTSAMISSANPSVGYAGASGGNHVKLDGNASELVMVLPTAGDQSFRMSFGLGAAGSVAAGDFALEVSKDNKMWAPLTYAPAVMEKAVLSASGWGQMVSVFTVSEKLDTLWLRFKPAVSGTYQVDDIVVGEGDGSGVVEFPRSAMKGLPQEWDLTKGKDNFPNWVSKQEIASEDGKAMFSFEKLPLNVHANNEYRYTGDGKTPVIVGLYLDDHYLLTIPVSDFSANTKLKVAASGFTSSTGASYFMIEWSMDGENWTAVNTQTKSITMSGETRDVTYTYQQMNSAAKPLFDEATGTFMVTQGLDNGNLYIRFRVCDRASRGTTNMTAAGKGTAVMSAVSVEAVTSSEDI